MAMTVTTSLAVQKLLHAVLDHAGATPDPVALCEALGSDAVRQAAVTLAEDAFARMSAGPRPTVVEARWPRARPLLVLDDEAAEHPEVWPTDPAGETR